MAIFLNTVGTVEYLYGLILCSIFLHFERSTIFSVIFQTVDELLIEEQLSGL